MLTLIFAAWLAAAPQSPASKAGSTHKAAAPARWPIQSLNVEGNHTYSTEEIIAVTGLKIGEVAGKPEFEAARDRLVATARFETVGYRFAPASNAAGYTASFQVIEAGPIYPVQMMGMHVPVDELNAWLKSRDPLYGPKIPATTTVLDREAKLIREFLATHDKDEKIVARVEALTAERFAIVFRPAGALPVVAEVKFEGNQALPAATLQNTISGVAFGLPYSEEGFRQLLDSAVRPLYEAHGYVRVAFPRVTTEPAKKADGLDVGVQVVEGASYKLGDVRVAGDVGARAAEYFKLAKFSSGETANFDEIGRSIDKITHRMRREGYLNATATTARQIHDDKKTVDLTVRLNGGPQFVFGTLTIEGLELNGEAAIRNRWAVKEGKPFNVDYPDFFLKHIREDGVFDKLGATRASVETNDQTHTVNVTLHFEPAPPEPEKKKKEEQ